MISVFLFIIRAHTPGGPGDSPETPQQLSQTSSKVRTELVNALSSNHEKRREITALKSEVTRLERELKEQRLLPSHREQPVIDNGDGGTECGDCVDLKQLLVEQKKDFEQVIGNLTSKLNEANNNQSELQTNMVDLVKTMDKKKLQDVNAQNTAMLKFVDDAKEMVRKELERVHQGQLRQLQNELEKVAGELLYTKEEYVNLCEDMKSLEQQVKIDVQDESKIELEELRLQLENEYNEQLKTKELELTNKYLEDLEKEKKEWSTSADAELKTEVERSLALAKTEWMVQHQSQKKQEITSAVQLAKMEWDHEMQGRSEEARKSDLEQLKTTWELQKEVIMVKLFILASQDKLFTPYHGVFKEVFPASEVRI